MTLRSLAPEASASANSATRPYRFCSLRMTENEQGVKTNSTPSRGATGGVEGWGVPGGEAGVALQGAGGDESRSLESRSRQ